MFPLKWLNETVPLNRLTPTNLAPSRFQDPNPRCKLDQAKTSYELRHGTVGSFSRLIGKQQPNKPDPKAHICALRVAGAGNKQRCAPEASVIEGLRIAEVSLQVNS